MVGKTIYYPCLYNKYFFHGVITITIHNIRSLKVQFMIVIFKLGYYSYAFFSTLGKATLCTRGDSYECETLETHQSCVSNAGCDALHQMRCERMPATRVDVVYNASKVVSSVVSLFF